MEMPSEIKEHYNEYKNWKNIKRKEKWMRFRENWIHLIQPIIIIVSSVILAGCIGMYTEAPTFLLIIIFASGYGFGVFSGIVANVK